MKKIFILLLVLLTGCSNNVYDNYVKELKEANNTTEIPFDINFYIDEVNEDRLIYQVIIDNFNSDLTDVKALVIHDVNTNDIFPSVGIVDESIDINENNKGIILVGYVDKKDKINFKVLVQTSASKYIYFYNY